jgi:DNA-directed RNA polymerase specialized sigma24 family protein
MHDAARLEAAQQALSRLRRCEREVLFLCVWSGLDYAAAAEALGVPVGTVRSRLSRARNKLRNQAFENTGGLAEVWTVRPPDTDQGGRAASCG